MSTTYYSGFYPIEDLGAKGSAAFSSLATNTATIYLYKRSNTALTISDVPNGDVVYSFATGDLDLTLVTNGWTEEIPVGDTPLYVVSVFVGTAEPTVTVETAEWAAPALLSKNGSNTAPVFLYQRNNTGVVPAAVPVSTTYTFATGVLSTTPPDTYSPWTQTIPDSTSGRFLFITTVTAVSESSTATITSGSWSTPRLFSVEGQSPAIINLTNDSIAVPSNSDGSSPNLAGASTTVSIFEGGTDVTASWTITPTASAGVTFTTSGNTYTVTGLTTDSGTITFTATRSGYSNIAAVFSISKAKAGVNGTPAVVYGVRSSLGVIKRNNSGAYTSPTIVVSAFSTTGSLAPSPYAGRFILSTSTDGVNYTNTYTSASNQSSYTYTLPASINFLRVRLFLAGGTATLLDEEIIPVADDGTNGVNGANGLNNAIVYLYQRAATSPLAPTGTFTYTFATSTLSGGTPGSWTQTIPANNGNPLWVIVATASSNTATDTIAATEFSSPVVLSQDGATGPNGLNTATVFLYQRATSAPAVPSTTTTYTFATGVLTGTLGSWTQTVPAGTDPLYVTTATAAATTATDTILTSEWATVRVLAQNGTNGTNGTNGSNNVVVLIYQRASSAPAAPSVTATYTFSTASLTGLNNGWSSTIPANNGQPLWVRTAVASSLTDTDTIASNEWSGANILTGAGLNTAAVFIYQRAASAPAAPSVDATYTFATGVITGLNNGWTSSVPTANGQPLWARQASANSAETTDIIAPGEWSAASIISQDGATGQAGAAAISGFLTNESASLFAYANGIVVSYGPATGLFRVFSGNTDISSSFTLSSQSNPQALTVTYSGQTYTVTGGFDANEDTASLTIRATGSGTWAGVTLDKVFSLSKTKGGYEIVASLPPAGDPRRFEGSMVFLTTDDKLYRFDGTNWTAAVPAVDITGQILNAQIADNAITGPKIVNSAVTETKISDSAITAPKISTNAITSDKIEANAITAGKIQAGAVTANKLLVVPNNINPDPLFVDETFWDVEANGWYFETSSGTIGTALGYNKYVVLWDGRFPGNPGTSSRSVLSKSIPFNGRNQILRLRARGWNASNQALWVGIAFYNSAGSILLGDYTPGLAAGVSAGDIIRQITVPNNTASIKVVILNAGGSTYSGTMAVTDIKIDIAATAELIVDGAVIADKIAANAIVAGKIAANAVTADKIEAGAVTAAKINVTQLSAITANVGDLTAGTIRNTSNSYRVDVTNGRTIVQTGSFMKVSGAPFGSTGQFIEWYGPYFANLTSCTESNSTYYLKTDGSAYFGGTLSAGILKNSAQTTDTTATASVTVGPFSTNGGTKTITLSYDYYYTHRCSEGTGSITGTQNISIVLEKSTNNGASWSTITTLTPTQTQRTVTGPEPGTPDTVTYRSAGSTTATDNTTTTPMLLRARLTSRVLPTFGGSGIFNVTETQNISVISIE